MKILPPTLRPNWRYLAVRVVSGPQIRRGALIGAINDSAISLLGDVNASMCNISLLGFEHGIAIVRCTREHTEEARCVLATIHTIKGSRVGFHVMGIAGTVKSATEKYIPQSDQSETGSFRVVSENVHKND